MYHKFPLHRMVYRGCDIVRHHILTYCHFFPNNFFFIFQFPKCIIWTFINILKVFLSSSSFGISSIVKIYILSLRKKNPALRALYFCCTGGWWVTFLTEYVLKVNRTTDAIVTVSHKFYTCNQFRCSPLFLMWRIRHSQA